VYATLHLIGRIASDSIKKGLHTFGQALIEELSTRQGACVAGES
jgi:cobalamin biosynthesis Mg chelatase CobN